MHEADQRSIPETANIIEVCQLLHSLIPVSAFESVARVPRLARRLSDGQKGIIRQLALEVYATDCPEASTERG